MKISKKEAQDLIIGAAIVMFSAPVIGSFIGSTIGAGAATFTTNTIDAATKKLKIEAPQIDINPFPDLGLEHIDFSRLDLNPFPDLGLERLFK